MPSDSDTGYVYTLSDPRTGDPKYVGATVDPRQRYHTHVTSPHSSDLAAWVQELAEQDMTPDMNIVQIDDIDGLATAERRVLKRVASEHDVLNTDMTPSYPGRGSSASMLGSKSPTDLRDVDEALLEYLAEGRVTPAYARDRMIDDGRRDVTSTYLGQRLQRLEEHDHAQNLYDTGLYELVDDPREGDDEHDS